MRATSRLLAETSKYLEAGRPTGLTGLLTHSSPRSALLYNYHSTLEKLSKFPESSVYRQSTEALTRHRLSIVEAVRPAGLEAWQSRMKDTVEKYPNAFKNLRATKGDTMNLVYKIAALSGQAGSAGGEAPVRQMSAEQRDREQARLEKTMSEADESEDVTEVADATADTGIKIEPEPALTTEQVEEIETKIGAGLVEEIIQVAEAEDALVDRMYESRVWEELVVKPTEGQWAYYERDAHTAKPN